MNLSKYQETAGVHILNRLGEPVDQQVKIVSTVGASLQGVDGVLTTTDIEPQILDMVQATGLALQKKICIWRRKDSLRRF